MRARKTWGPASKVGKPVPGGAPPLNPDWERDIRRAATESLLPLTIDQLAEILWPEKET